MPGRAPLFSFEQVVAVGLTLIVKVVAHRRRNKMKKRTAPSPGPPA